MGKETYEKASIDERLTGVEHYGSYNPETDRTGEGYGSTPEEAAANAEKDLDARELADKAQEYIKKDNE